MEALGRLAQGLLFYFDDNRGDKDDVYIPSSFSYVHLFHDDGFEQIKKHQRIIELLLS